MSEQISDRQRPSSPLDVFVFVVLFGPPLGGLALFLVLSIEAFFVGNPGDIVGLVGVSAFIVVFSYFFGGLQAIVAGIVLALISRPDGAFTYVQAVLVATVVGSVFGIFIVANKMLSLELTLLMAGNGVFSALALRALFAKRFRPINA